MISHFPGENEEQKALQAENPIRDTEFSENIEADSVENPVEATDISSELPADITEKADDSADKDKFMQQTKPQEPDRWHFPFSSKEQNKSNSDIHEEFQNQSPRGSQRTP